VVAFARGGDGGQCIAIAPRLPIKLGGRWEGTTLALPERPWLNELTGERVAGGKAALAALLGRFPVALLSRAEDGTAPAG
jgi:(1->4)-alpha-D-glucan 1-alpha-D-glucosylmutase